MENQSNIENNDWFFNKSHNVFWMTKSNNIFKIIASYECPILKFTYLNKRVILKRKNAMSFFSTNVFNILKPTYIETKYYYFENEFKISDVK